MKDAHPHTYTQNNLDLSFSRQCVMLSLALSLPLAEGRVGGRHPARDAASRKWPSSPSRGREIATDDAHLIARHIATRAGHAPCQGAAPLRPLAQDLLDDGYVAVPRCFEQLLVLAHGPFIPRGGSPPLALPLALTPLHKPGCLPRAH